jgi:anti-sigma B factor antagonist
VKLSIFDQKVLQIVEYSKKWFSSSVKVVTSIVMNITERTEEDIPVVSISGDIDLETSPKLREFLKPKSSKKTPLLLLDFSGVNYIDSSGLATLIEYFQAVQGFHGKLALASLSPRVKNVFEIVRLEQIFSLHPDIPSALAALKA